MNNAKTLNKVKQDYITFAFKLWLVKLMNIICGFFVLSEVSVIYHYGHSSLVSHHLYETCGTGHVPHLSTPTVVLLAMELFDSEVVDRILSYCNTNNISLYHPQLGCSMWSFSLSVLVCWCVAWTITSLHHMGKIGWSGGTEVLKGKGNSHRKVNSGWVESELTRLEADSLPCWRCAVEICEKLARGCLNLELPWGTNDRTDAGYFWLVFHKITLEETVILQGHVL